MIDCRFKPITQWPKKPTHSYNRRNRFRAAWSETLDLIEKELTKIRARDITIEAFFRPDEIRNDGWPRSNARPSQPGVILRFTTKKGELEFACDRFADWQQNLRAIALGLEKLRMIDDYGIVAEEEQQYRGWYKELPASSANDEAHNLALVLIKFAQLKESDARRILSERDFFDSAWREGVRRTHPDQGGQSSEFQQVMNARDRLKQLKGWT